MAQEQKTVSGTVSNTDLPSTQGQEEATDTLRTPISTASQQTGSVDCPCRAELRDIANHLSGIKIALEKLSSNSRQNNPSGQTPPQAGSPACPCHAELQNIASNLDGIKAALEKFLREPRWRIPSVASWALILYAFFIAVLMLKELHWQTIVLSAIVTIALITVSWAAVSMEKED